MIYLKTYFYVNHEVQFLVANLLEAYDHIDKFIICEFNRTHTGRPCQLMGWDYLKEKFPKDKLDKVMYLPIDSSEMCVEAYNDEDTIHNINEPIMRSAFMKFIELRDEDIIVSVDADEIIYEHIYPRIIDAVETDGVCQLNLHQFFYKKNYLWKGKDFLAPTAIKYKYIKERWPCSIRYEGPVLPEKAGCHFSWCMSPEEMVYKLHTYSHPRYRHLANVNTLKNAIENKEYPFDPSIEFEIVELDPEDPIIPRSMR
jgi:hypothetical protein